MHYLIILFIIFGSFIALFLIVMHLGFRAPRQREKIDPSAFGIPFSQETIPTASGKKLFAWLLPIAVKNEINETVIADQTIIIIHGWGGNSEFMLPVAKPFYQTGINVLLIDSRNHGNSDSDSFSSLPRFAEDMDSAIDWLKLNHPEISKKIAILGHSVGAGAVLFSSSKRDDINAVISISAFAHPDSMMRRFLGGLHFPKFLINIILKYIEWIIGQPFETIAPVNTICDSEIPILLVHGKDDRIIPIEDAHEIFSSCPKAQVSLIEIDEAGHESVDKIEENSDKLVGFLATAGFSV